jgi:hypothetical protein
MSVRGEIKKVSGKEQGDEIKPRQMGTAVHTMKGEPHMAQLGWKIITQYA